MDYEKKLKDALKDENTDYEVVRWIESNFPEIAESVDGNNKRISNEITRFLKQNNGWNSEWLAWLEKQGGNNNQNWKPSKSQINALEHFVMGVAESGYASPYDDNTKLLKSLMNDLRKLEEQGEQKPILDFKASNWYVSEVDGKIHDLTYNPTEKKKLKKLTQSVTKISDKVWSEEDKEIVEVLNEYIKKLDIFFSEIKIGGKDIVSREFREKVQHWLKSLKNRVQPKQEWSDEDEKMLNFCIKHYADGNFITWLESLKTKLGGK